MPTRSRGSRVVGYDLALNVTVADPAKGSVAGTALPMSGGGRAHALAFAARTPSHLPRAGPRRAQALAARRPSPRAGPRRAQALAAR
ncbi:hypothetical protein ACWEKR_28775, partial [Nocardia sp. NPDC004573]